MNECIFLDNKCKLVLNNNFVLMGVVRDVDHYGILFETTQKTSWHAFSNIKELALED